ncbi:MAG: polysaccharide biosynthesis C-terminal domain-containing protein [bacterium]|nr:polysaccharide biosynthesis C-terminal domain-containing protein [bacterium]
MANLSLGEVFKDIRYYMPARVIPALVTFVSIAIFTRLLSPEEYGLYTLVIITISIVSTLAFRWLEDAVLRYFEEHEESASLPLLLSTVILTFLPIVLIISAGWFTSVLVFKFKPHLTILLLVGTITLFMQAGYSLILTINRAARNAHKYTYYAVIQSICTLLIAWYLIYSLHWNATAILLATAIASGVVFLYEIIYFVKRYQIKLSLFSFQLVRNLAIYGFPLIGVSIGMLVLASIDRYMIQYFKGAIEVGVYSAGYRIADSGTNIIYMMVMLPGVPVIYQTYEQKGKLETVQLLEKLIEINIAIMLPIFCGVFMLSKDVIKVLLGGSFQGASYVLTWVTGGCFCFALAQYFYKPLELKKTTKYVLYLILGAATLNIIFNFILIPKLGGRGAAISTFLAYTVCLLGAWLLGNRTFNLRIRWNRVWKLVISAIGMMFVLMLVLPNWQPGISRLVLKVIIGVVSYVTLLIILREDNIMQVIRKLTNALQN